MPSDEAAPILIAGPTASGKSALALQLARRYGGIVINADSMQVYRELCVLTARPAESDIGAAPHRLYGHVGADEAYSVARWLEDVGRALAEAAGIGARPIVVGGTGLYFKALTEGLSHVPPIPPEVRRRWRQIAQEEPAATLHDLLRSHDPALAARLAPTDVQRMTRALEVIDATGRSLAEWQARPGLPLIPLETAERMLVSIPRDELHRRCDLRFDLMMEAGALAEVRALASLALPPDAPVMRALGVAQLAAHLAGSLARDEAVAQAKAATRQYVRRQTTWARKHMADWTLTAI